MKTKRQIVYTLDEAYSLFVLDAKSRRFTKRTLEFYDYHLKDFFKWLLARPQYNVTHLHQVSSTHIKTYFVNLQERQFASATQHNAARALRAFFNVCVREELLTVSPFAKVKMPQEEKKILPAFSKEDVKKLVAKCQSPREKAIVLCLLDSGCRATEFVNLNVGDVSLEHGEVRVKQGKQQKDRTTYIGAKARKQLARYLVQRNRPADKEPLFVSERGGKRLTRSGLRQILVKLGERAEVEHCHPHTFRRSCALWMLRGGASIYHVQRLLGHDDLDTLKQYLALLEGDVKDAHQRFGAVDTNL